MLLQDLVALYNASKKEMPIISHFASHHAMVINIYVLSPFARGQSHVPYTEQPPSWHSFRLLKAVQSMASTRIYETANVDLEENVEKTPLAEVQNVGHHQPSGLEVRTLWRQLSHYFMADGNSSDTSTWHL